VSSPIRVAIAIGALSLPFGGDSADAQDRGNPEALITGDGFDPRELARTDPALLLAQALVAEAGWTVHDDQAAILHVLKRRARLPAFRRDDGLRPEVRVALSYVRTFNPRRAPTERQRRMRALDWPLLEERAPGVVDIVRRWVDGERVPDPCRGLAWHWGSASDTRRSALPRVDCGRTTNRYLGAPLRAQGGPAALTPIPARTAALRALH